MIASLPCFAITAPGLEPITAGELRELGVMPNVVPGGVEWTGDQTTLFAANLHLRTASRVVVRVARFRARSFIELERHLGRVDWRPFIPDRQVVQLRVSSARSKLYHERAIAERVERMLADRAGAVPSSRVPLGPTLGSVPLADPTWGSSDATSARSPRDRSERDPGSPDAPGQDRPTGPPGGGSRSASAQTGPPPPPSTAPTADPGSGSPSNRPSTSRAPSTEDEEADSDAQLVIVRFHRDECTISVDASGELLHRRGYRLAVARAPVRETIAAAILLAVGWDGRTPLLDPFCGSGTIPLEAGLMAANVPPGLASAGLQPRRFAFTDWPSFDPERWERTVRDARSGIREADVTIRGSDRDEGAIRAARDNAGRAGLVGLVGLEMEVAPLTRAMPPAGEGWLLTNPPYGLRVGERKRLRDLYSAFGNWARSRLAGWSIGMLAPDLELPGYTGLSWEERLRTVNGGVPVRLLTTRVNLPGAPPPGAP